MMLMTFFRRPRKAAPVNLETPCPCGHAASWHAHEGGAGWGNGCQSRKVDRRYSDAYGCCTCPKTEAEVASWAGSLSYRRIEELERELGMDDRP